MASRNPQRPNVLSLVSDDQGAWALGAAGNPEIATPTLDALAASGALLTNFFCASPVCSPARASLLTGRIPSQHGVHDWVRGGNVGSEVVQYLAGEVTISDLLAAAGYACGLIGKWHLGDSATSQHGFSYWFVHQAGSSSYHGAPMTRDGRLFDQSGYLTDVLADDAVGYLQRAADDRTPFYLGLHFTAPHSPWVGEHPRHLTDSYDDCPFDSCPQPPPHPWSKPKGPHERAAQAEPRESLKGYFAAVTAMDTAIGRVLATLDELRLRGSTLVSFVGDNGFNAGHHGIWGKGNGTLPLNMYEESVNVPAIFAQPGRIPAGVVSDALLGGYDVLPTLLDHLDLPAHEPTGLPGRSFAPLLSADLDAERDHLVITDEYGPTRMVRTHEAKYIHRYPYGPHELYDLRDDPGERTNVADDPTRCQTLTDLRATLEDWYRTYVDLAHDGVYQAVRGLGQLRRVGPTAAGQPTQADDEP